MKYQLLLLILIPIFAWIGYSYITYQEASAIDCSMITGPSNLAPKNSDVGLVTPFGNESIIQTNKLCFDAAEVKIWSICYYVTCGDDQYHTVNYQGKPIQKSLFKPDLPHMYPLQENIK